MADFGLTANLGQKTSKGTRITSEHQAARVADMENLIVIADNTEAVLAEMDKALARALEKIGLVAEGYAVRLCPVDTGRLRNSITHTMDEDAVYIGTNVEYAPYMFDYQSECHCAKT